MFKKQWRFKLWLGSKVIEEFRIETAANEIDPLSKAWEYVEANHKKHSDHRISFS